ncbi:MAG: hypothetical protein HYZ73_01130 [Elusimicrobia bacterium]|nr:hypothetical protein [Elusimicrobiota bacterium]
MLKRWGSSRNNQRGLSQIELLLGVLIISVISVALLSALQLSVVSTVQNRVQTSGAQLLQMAYTQLRSVDFYQVFPCDSSLPRYGLRTDYPNFTTLNQIRDKTLQLGFSKFTIELAFMRRDTTDANGNGFTSDLIPFADNGFRVDRYDPNIRYFDQNGNGDYYDTYYVGVRRVSEMPDTHLKLVTLKLWKGNKVVLKDAQLFNLEGFTGKESPSSESPLTLSLDVPANNASLYDLTTSTRANAFALAITRSYPSSVVAYRADAANPPLSYLRLSGTTEPSATVRFYVGYTTGTPVDSVPTDVSGNFNFQSGAITARLVEGRNQLFARTFKGSLTSPFALREVIRDLAPPLISSAAPPSPTQTLSPYIAGVLVDSPTQAGAEVSGITAGVITFKLDGVVAGSRYDPSSGVVVLVDSGTLLPPVLSTGTHTVILEGGDNAYYKVSKTWSFQVAIDTYDPSPPAIANKSPTGMTSNPQPVISVRVFDNQSGINPQSIVMTLDGAVVVNASNVAQAYDPSTGVVQYQPPAPLGAGSHDVTITVSHWATAPPDRTTRSEPWSFTVNGS